MISRRVFLYISGWMASLPIMRTLTSAAGPTWYVDSLNGDDADNGRDPTAAFQTLGRLTAAPIAAGDTILLARGSHWRQTLALPVGNLSIDAYGVGPRPLIDCSDPIRNSEFAPVAGTSSVYEATIHPEVAAFKTWINCWEEDSYLARVASVAECDATVGSYTVSADTGSPPVTLYIHPTDSSSPLTNGRRYAVTQRRYALVTQPNCTVRSIRFRRNLHENGSVFAERYNTFEDCIFEDGSKHNLYLKDGCTFRDCVSRRSYYGGVASSHFVYNENQPGGAGLLFERCRVEEPIYNEPATGFYGHNNVSGTFGPVALVDCSVINCGIGFSGTDASAFSYLRCHTEGTRFGWRLGAPVHHVLDGCTYRYEAPLGRVIATQVTGASGTVTTLDAELQSTVGGAVFMQHDSTLTLRDSCLVCTAVTGSRNLLRVHDNVIASLDCRDNHYSGWLRGYDLDPTATVSLASDENCFAEPTMRNRVGGVDYSGPTAVSDYQQGTGLDPNSQIGNCQCALPTPTPSQTPTATSTPGPTATSTPTRSPTATGTPTSTPTASASPPPSASPTATTTWTPTPGVTRTPTAGPTRSPTATRTPTAPTPSPPPSPTGTLTPTALPGATMSPTATPVTRRVFWLSLFRR